MGDGDADSGADAGTGSPESDPVGDGGDLDEADGGVDYAGRASSILGFSRWWQIVAAAGMMAAVSPYQYVWSSIEGSLARSLDIGLPALGAVFSFYVVFQSLSQFPAGKWRDSRGPGALTFVAALLAGGGYIGLAYATALWQLYVLYSLGAIGVGIVYTVAVNTAVKWFPDRTGLTTGVGTMAFAAGSALVVPYVRANDSVAAYSDVLRNLVAAASATLLPVAAGVSRMILGEASDRFDRKTVMAASFVLAGVFRLALIGAGRAEAGVAFVGLVMAAMFFSSPLFVYFPSVIADYYGAKNSSGNYAVLYTAKVGGGVFAGTVTGYLVASFGWIPTFALGGRRTSGSGMETETPAPAD